MEDWWYFWSRQEWYWSALSFLCIFLIVLLMMCLCWKFCHSISEQEDDHFILSRDPSPSLIILHAQTPSESEKILRHYDSIRSETFHQQQQQQQYQSTASRYQTPYQHNYQFSAQPYDPGAPYSSQSTVSRPPPYAPNYYK